jgi:hypothetical protein
MISKEAIANIAKITILAVTFIAIAIAIAIAYS